MITVPAAVAPLVWALVFVLVVALVYALRWLEIALHPKLERIMIFLGFLIVAVILILWVLGFFGLARMG